VKPPLGERERESKGCSKVRDKLQEVAKRPLCHGGGGWGCSCLHLLRHLTNQPRHPATQPCPAPPPPPLLLSIGPNGLTPLPLQDSIPHICKKIICLPLLSITPPPPSHSHLENGTSGTGLRATNETSLGEPHPSYAGGHTQA